MWTWKVLFIEFWSFHSKDDDGDESDFIVAAKNGDDAIAKAKAVCWKRGSFKDEDTGKTETLKKVSLIGLERLNWIDA